MKSDFTNIINLVKKPVTPKRKKLKSIKKLAKELETISHTFIRKRDGINGQIKGYCIDCGKYAEGQQWQAGHFEPSGASGALLRFHPHNMNGQAGSCNVGYVQERVKVAYTLKMIDMYGREYVDKLRALKQRSIKADRFFYEEMIALYKTGNEKLIVEYLENIKPL